MSDLRTVSYVVLALVGRMPHATPYDLERLAGETMTNFWAVPHTVVYAETQRMAAVGLLSIDQEETGRRRRRYSLTALGRDALDEWLAAPTTERRQTHDPGLLKIFAGADPRTVAADQLATHRAQLRLYEQIDRKFEPEGEDGAGPDDVGTDTVSGTGSDFDAALRTTLAAGILIERQYLAFWQQIADTGRAIPPRPE